MIKLSGGKAPTQQVKKTEKIPGLNSIYLFCLAFLFFAVIYYIAGWPISGQYDVDLWTHLYGGRYLFLHTKIPDSGQFSFIASERHWINYYWLFQATVYSIYSFLGYHGLIWLRTALYLFMVLAIALLFLKKTRKGWIQYYYVFVIAIVTLVLLPRFIYAVRPHAFSYLFIVLFIGLFESGKQRLLWLLPILSVFWANLHGIEYPVMMLICLAYLSDLFIERLKTGTSFSRKTLLSIFFILLALYAIFINPFGVNLLFSPFKAAPYIHLYIAEMKKPELSSFFFYDFSTASNFLRTLSNLIILLAFISCTIGIATKKVRLSHLLLFAGGVYLLSQADRFRTEFVLLSLPMMKAHPPLPAKYLHEKLPELIKLCGIIILLAFIIGFLNKMLRPRPHYPVSFAGIPAGISVFLNSVEANGKILNNPNHGSFFQWSLNDGYKIYMNMELMYFTDEEFFFGFSAFIDRKALEKMISIHRPAFFVPSVKNSRFKNNIKKFPDYSPVFFDNTAVLYVDRKQHFEISAKYSLDPVLLSDFDETGMAQLSKERAFSIQKELRSMHKIYPYTIRVNQLLAKFALRQNDFEEAAKYAKLLIENFPEKQNGFQLLGDIYFGQQKFEQALSSYNKASSRAGGSARSVLSKKIRDCISNSESKSSQ